MLFFPSFFFPFPPPPFFFLNLDLGHCFKWMLQCQSQGPRALLPPFSKVSMGLLGELGLLLDMGQYGE